MGIIKGSLKQYNGPMQYPDTMYPKTSIDMVEGLQSKLDKGVEFHEIEDATSVSNGLDLADSYLATLTDKRATTLVTFKIGSTRTLPIIVYSMYNDTYPHKALVTNQAGTLRLYSKGQNDTLWSVEDFMFDSDFVATSPPIVNNEYAMVFVTGLYVVTVSGNSFPSAIGIPFSGSDVTITISIPDLTKKSIAFAAYPQFKDAYKTDGIYAYFNPSNQRMYAYYFAESPTSAYGQATLTLTSVKRIIGY